MMVRDVSCGRRNTSSIMVLVIIMFLKLVHAMNVLVQSKSINNISCLYRIRRAKFY